MALRQMLIVFVAFIALALCTPSLIQHGNDDVEIECRRNVMTKLLKTIRASQSTKSTEYRPKLTYPPLISWQRQEGIYDSFVHLNFNGNLGFLRNVYKFPDDNSFVTMFILEALIDSQQYAPQLRITDQELLRGVKAIITHKDQNVDQDVPLFSFWNQIKIDGAGYRASPPNIDVPLGELRKGFGYVKTALEWLHLGFLAELVDKALEFEDSFQTSFRIPADSDDTGCNLALGMKLLTAQSQFPLTASQWVEYNKSPQTIVAYYLQYAYYPNSKTYPLNAVDPRTYLWIRKFIKERVRDPNLAIISTWMQQVNEVEAQWEYKRMPFNVNNVDLSVVANTIFGFTQFLIVQRGDVSVMHTDAFKKMYVDNVDLLVWSLKNRIVEVYQTNVLLYYPPKFAFYWFVARILSVMKNANLRSLPKYVRDARDKLELAMKYYGTVELIREVECQKDQCYWDEFLGNADSAFGRAHEKHEDRVFSTAMALNALIDTFTTKAVTTGSDSLKLKLDRGVPSNVRQVIEKGHTFMAKYANKYPKENAFFSASIKTAETTPVSFPHNSFKWLNGTDAGPCSKFSNPFEFGILNVARVVASVSGYIEEDKYQDMIKNQVCFGNHVPENLNSANLSTALFPYWSSPALTNSMQLLTLAKYEAISQ
ncbi:hypothetical protein MP228_001437 [Amoeboaphelidium protococcarum]|nr:hypothetical protein MP228_001437 [Amoeboaphelidium protococcarum]